MKYQVGEKVKYDSGEWVFHGTITAVFDNSICPCYRIIVESMEKTGCKFSIMQFEFELEPVKETDSDNKKGKWEISEAEFFQKYFAAQSHVAEPAVVKTIPEPVLIPEPELMAEPESIPVPEPEPLPLPLPEKKQRKKRELKPKTIVVPEVQEVEPQMAEEPKVEPVTVEEPISEQLTAEPPVIEPTKRRKGDVWYKYFDLYQQGEKSTSIYNWIADNRRQFKTGKLKDDKFEKLVSINFSFDATIKKAKAKKEEAPVKKSVDAWEKNFDAFTKGERNSTIFAWITQNRRLYKTGKLKDEQFEKLIEINFPFDSQKRTNNNWERQLELWKKGERNSLQQWRQLSVKQYVNGKLSKDKIEKLKAVGILK